MLAAAEEIRPALRDHWEDVTTAMHDADARHLYVDVAEPLAERARARDAGADGATGRARAPERRERTFRRPSAPTSAARSIAEAEAQLEKELRSGYRVVVTFESRGEAERARYNLNRVEPRFLERRRRRRTRRPVAVRRGAAQPTASSRPSCGWR